MPCSPRTGHRPGRCAANKEGYDMHITARISDPAIVAVLQNSESLSRTLRELCSIALAYRANGNAPPQTETLKEAVRQLTGIATNINQVVARVHQRGENAEVIGALAAVKSELEELRAVEVEIRRYVEYWRKHIQ